MYKVLISGADQNELNNLAALVSWKDYDLELVDLLCDGTHIIPSLETRDIDILIVSIPTPQVDVTTLLQQIRSRKLNTHCIIIAKASDLDYAQKAILLEIENFLLKPVSKQILIDTLCSITCKIQQAVVTQSPVNNISTFPESVFCDPYMPFHINQELENLMINREYSQCREYLDRLFSQISATAESPMAILRNYAIEFVIFTINLMRSYNIDVSRIIGDHAALFYKILNFQNIQELLHWIQCFMTTSIDALDNRNLRFSPCIARAVAHVEKNFAQDISLKTLAYDLNINAAYLGQLFKSDTGQLFSAYLNQTRIENAKKLLKNTSLNLSEVSLQCGYTNISYFYNIFKKYTGQTPSQYRKVKEK